MAITKFMQVMFSANERDDEELAGQVAEDIESAKENGEVDTEEVNYKHLGDGNVMIHDKVNNEVTLAKKANDEHETYDLVAVPTEDLEMYLHMDETGVNPDESVEGVDEEHYEDHMEAPMDEMEDEEIEDPLETQEEEEEEKEFSYFGDNVAVQRIFSDQEFMEKIFNEVIESEETAKVGDIKVEKIDDDTILVTSEATGDQARVELDKEGMEVTELEQKEMSEEEEIDDEEPEFGVGSDEQYEPMFVVGVDTDNHVIVDAPVYNEEDAEDLASRLEEAGVEGVSIFECPDEAREHAEELLSELGVDNENQIGEPEQAEFSDYGVYVTRYFSYDELEEMEDRFFSEIDPEDCTEYMMKLFSETEEDAPEQEKIEDALESGEEIEEDGEIITPISDDTVVVEDKNNEEFTKITLDGDEMDVEKISEEEAEDLLKDIAVEDDSKEEEEEEEEEEEKEFSEVFVDPFELDSSEVTSYMMKLFSESEDDEESMQEDIEGSLEGGEQVETDDEIITPISDDTVVVEDKENGEYTKVVVDGEDMHVEKISEEEAEDLLEDVDVEETEEEKEEREFSESNEMILKFFAEVSQPAPVQAQIPQEALQAQAQQEVQQAAQEIPAVVEETPSVEAIEDQALVAVQAIHEAAQKAANMIQQAKEAPVPGQEEDLREAQFSCEDDEAEERFYSETETLGNWLHNHTR